MSNVGMCLSGNYTEIVQAAECSSSNGNVSSLIPGLVTFSYCLFKLFSILLHFFMNLSASQKPKWLKKKVDHVN